MKRWMIALAASLAAAQAGAQSSLSLLPDGHYEWASYLNKDVSEVSSVDGTCFVRVQALPFASAIDIREIALHARPGGEINIEVTTHFFQEGKPGLELDVAIPVGKHVQRITFGHAAALLWEREHSRCVHPG